MPPSSRGFNPFHNFHHHVSPCTRGIRGAHLTATPPSVRSTKPQLSIPRSSAKEPPRPTASQPPVIDTTPSIPSRPSLVMRILEPFLPKNPRSRRSLFRILLISPTLLLAIMHLPYENMSVNGPSMSPFLNPNYNSDEDLNQSKDSILVQTGKLYDINWRRKWARGDREQIVPHERFRRGTIITFYCPHNPDKIAVKRVVGIPGDRVQPLPGYPGGDEPVVVPWNHVWVEGDADSRAKSIDSNWYGPISQNMIIGEVKAVLKPFWNPTWLNSDTHTWPAMLKGRVEENAVREATVDPEIIRRQQEWTNGTNEKALTALKEDPESFIEKFWRSERARDEVRKFYRSAALMTVAGDPDSETHELAMNIIKEMELVYGRPALMEGMIKVDREKINDLNNEVVANAGKKVQSKKLADLDADAAAAASEMENVLKEQGWTLERDGNNRVKSRPLSN